MTDIAPFYVFSNKISWSFLAFCMFSNFPLLLFLLKINLLHAIILPTQGTHLSSLDSFKKFIIRDFSHYLWYFNNLKLFLYFSLYFMSVLQSECFFSCNITQNGNHHFFLYFSRNSSKCMPIKRTLFFFNANIYKRSM